MKKRLLKISAVMLSIALTIGNMTAFAEDKEFPYKVGDTPGNILIDPSNKDTKGWKKYNEAYQDGSIGQCVWYAKGRFCEIYGIYVQYMYFGDDKSDWITNIQKGNVEYIIGDEKEYGSVAAISDINDIRDKSIAVYAPSEKGDAGHVVFVEYVERDSKGNPKNVYFTEANGLYDLNEGKFDPGYDGIVQKVTFQKFKNQFVEKLIGYVIPETYPEKQS